MEQENNKKQKALYLTRRMFLQLGLWISGLASTWGILQFLSYEPSKENLLPSITLEQPFNYLLGSVTYVPEVKAWLMHDEGGIYAVSATCSHLGCRVKAEEAQFVCPCHGSQFDLSGRLLHGPATTALPSFEVLISEDGRVVIDRRVTVAPIIRLKLGG